MKCCFHFIGAFTESLKFEVFEQGEDEAPAKITPPPLPPITHPPSTRSAIQRFLNRDNKGPNKDIATTRGKIPKMPSVKPSEQIIIETYDTIDYYDNYDFDYYDYEDGDTIDDRLVKHVGNFDLSKHLGEEAHRLRKHGHKNERRYGT